MTKKRNVGSHTSQTEAKIVKSSGVEVFLLMQYSVLSLDTDSFSTSWGLLLLTFP